MFTWVYKKQSLGYGWAKHFYFGDFMKLVAVTLLGALISIQALASQIQVNQADEPVCYRGNPKSALEELLSLPYDPILKGGRVFRGSRDGSILVYAVQIDENGWLQQTITLPPCK